MLISASTDVHYTFLQAPTFIMEGRYAEQLKPVSKLLYILLYNKMLLSLKNGWINRNGAVYVRMSREDMAEELGVSKPTAIAAFNALVQCGLVCEKQFSGKVSAIFFCQPKEETAAMRRCSARQSAQVIAPQPKTAKMEQENFFTACSGEPVKILDSTGKDLLPAYIGINQIDYNQNNSIHQSDITHTEMDGKNFYEEKLSVLEEQLAACDRRDFAKMDQLLEQKKFYQRLSEDFSSKTVLQVEELIRDQIEYEQLADEGTVDLDLVDNIVSLIAETLKKPSSSQSVRERLLSITKIHIVGIADSLRQYCKPIRNFRNFLLKCIINSASTYSAYLHPCIGKPSCAAQEGWAVSGSLLSQIAENPRLSFVM